MRWVRRPTLDVEQLGASVYDRVKLAPSLTADPATGPRCYTNVLGGALMEQGWWTNATGTRAWPMTRRERRDYYARHLPKGPSA